MTPVAAAARAALQASESESEEDIPLTAEELTLQEHVGTGSTAEVYKGLWRNQVVAIKTLTSQSRLMADSEKVALEREMSILGRANHPNLVHMFGFICAQRPWRIVTEYCEGGTLFDLLYEREDVEITWALRMKVCKDIAAAMDYLHRFSPPIVHRDLKSLNMLLAKELQPPSSSSGPPHRGSQPTDLPVIKVSDFGLARMKDKSEDDWGQMTNGAGTHNWMAPEVLGGSVYDERVDVYSYAMVVFEVVCIEVPFDEEDQQNLSRRIIQGLRPNLEEAWPPDAPPLLARLVTDCWAHEPELRPPFRDVVAALEVVSRGLDDPGAARP